MKSKQEKFDQLFAKAPIVGIIRGYDSSTCFEIAHSFDEAGLTTLEVTMNTPAASEIIKALSTKFPQLNIGAGTVVDMEGLHAALKAGAQFIVTPIVDKEVILECVSHKIPVFPGAYTPTEIYQAWSLGATAVKIFPATQLGTTFIKDVLAPLNQVKLLPTGGVSVDNIRSFFEAGSVGAGMGSSLIDKALVREKNWKGLVAHFKSVKEQIKGF